MLGRYFYHAFWNFYDYLGTLTLVGAIYTLLSLGLAAAVVGFTDISVVSGKIVIALLALIQFGLSVVCLAALLPFCATAARNEPARWPHLKKGVQNLWPAVAKVLGIWSLVLALLVVNFFFYLQINTRVESAGLRMGLIIISATVGWLTAAWVYFGTPWLCGLSAGEDKVTVKQSMAKGLMSIALLPGIWFVVLLILLCAIAVGVYTRLGLIFVLPIMASFGQTAFYLSAQYAEFLAVAREELGEGQKLKLYKRRARELAWEWEHRQPRRTFKELIRPWDY